MAALTEDYGLSGGRGLRPHRPWVLAVGPGGSDESLDNGRTWRPFALDGCHVVAFAPDSKFGWAAGNKGKIVRIAGQTVVRSVSAGGSPSWF